MRKVAWLLAIGMAALACGEACARLVLGLGTPPLSIPHPQIEYMFKPGQSVLRFGNRIEINQYGMRSEPFEAQPAFGECRIIAFGDSVLNGGSLSDQGAIATAIWRSELSRQRAGPVVVGNVSAGSWGPGNWLAYVRQYGFFGANLVVLAISSHDIYDNPEFGELDPSTHPQSVPRSSLVEGLTRYLPKIAAMFYSAGPERATAPLPPPGRGERDLQAFLREAKAAVPRVVVVQFLERAEFDTGPMEGYRLIGQIAEREGVTMISSEAIFRQAMAENGEQFRDSIHPNDAGQAALARIFATIENPCGD